jgi:hypothetical protein
MLNTFDWLRRSDNGAELLATLDLIKHAVFSVKVPGLGAPLSALNGPCQRCYIYARCGPHELYCSFCKMILARAKRVAFISRKSVIIWAAVNQLPKAWREGNAVTPKYLLGSYVHDQNRFLAMLERRKLKPWLQDFILYHGADLNGLFQIFPPLFVGGQIGMSGVLCFAVHHGPRVPMERMMVQFYSSPFQLLKPRERDRQGLLTYEAAEFLSLLEMAEVFRAKLFPHEQRQLQELLHLNDAKEEQFYWGRFLGQLHQEAKDMLAAWRIRQWPKSRIALLYELIDYAALPNTD